ncbi:hypothetical protein FRAAL4548 [Frankia alni ACN14a]|uniref:Uncharacterized protein n=1 Tax=Frankia alni (strain DSM 45986 / CECT 9034 / ACN14a) TaxID=326424 RepID=Q0RH43_FRAAA|nr:hypothetical protein FRAAL4548 [Frankia alni ACN14a]
MGWAVGGHGLAARAERTQVCLVRAAAVRAGLAGRAGRAGGPRPHHPVTVNVPVQVRDVMSW